MNLTITRTEFTETETIGTLDVDGVFFCYTLEDTIRDVKVYGKTAIPYGSYEVVISYSNRFKKMMPLLLNVPNFAGIRIHKGNTHKDTEGCILVGEHKATGMILKSKLAYDRLFKLLSEAEEKIYINITKLQSHGHIT